MKVDYFVERSFQKVKLCNLSVPVEASNPKLDYISTEKNIFRQIM